MKKHYPIGTLTIEEMSHDLGEEFKKKGFEQAKISFEVVLVDTLTGRSEMRTHFYILASEKVRNATMIHGTFEMR